MELKDFGYWKTDSNIKITCKYINARVNDVDIELEADSGSYLNLFSRNYFQQFCNKLQRLPKLIKDDAQFTPQTILLFIQLVIPMLTFQIRSNQ